MKIAVMPEMCWQRGDAEGLKVLAVVAAQVWV